MRRALWMAAGVILWALHFTVIYGFTGVACARGFGEAAPWVVGVATVFAAVLAGLVVLRGARRGGEFESWLSAGLAAFALLAILWEGVSAAMVAPCV